MELRLFPLKLPICVPTQGALLQLVAIAGGLALRLLEYIRHNSLWGDEAMLALSIASRSFAGLLRPLAYGQVAPVPFLWAERLILTLTRVNEWTLRAVPLICGLALCVVVLPVARRLLRPKETFVALVLIAFSQILIRYSAEVKPYSLDALVSVGLVWAAVNLMIRMEDRRSWVLLAGLGGIAVVCSLTAAFVCLGIAAALAMSSYQQRRLDRLPVIALLSLLWLSLFAATYALLYHHASAAPYMREFWEGAFLTPGSPQLLPRFRAALSDTASVIDPASPVLGLSAVTLALVLLGAVILCRRHQIPGALLLIIPATVPFFASSLKVYPLASRLLVFAVPLLIMLLGVGIVGLAEWVERRARTLRSRWVVALLVLPAVITTLASLFYQRDQQMRPMVRELKARWRDREPVYVFHRVVPAWLFYSTDWSKPDLKQLEWAMKVSGPGGLGHENGPSRGPRAPGEGKELAYCLEEHPILLGTSSGVQGRPMFGYLPREPDPGWASNEAVRMNHAGAHRVWMLVGNSSHQGLDLGNRLLGAVQEEGGKATLEYSLEDGRLYRLELRPGT